MVKLDSSITRLVNPGERIATAAKQTRTFELFDESKHVSSIRGILYASTSTATEFKVDKDTAYNMQALAVLSIYK